MNWHYLKQHVPFSDELYQLKRRWQGRERHCSWGTDFPDKTFYIIGQDNMGAGLFWIINKTLMHIMYAVERGWVPVVDYQTHPTQYTAAPGCRDFNLWEVFFEQPCGYALADVWHARHVVINSMRPAPRKKYLMGQYEFYDNPDRIAWFRECFGRYIRLNKQADKRLADALQQVLHNQQHSTLGLLCRGTDYLKLKPKGHPVQPTVEQVIADARRAMREQNLTQVFVATEDADILEALRSEFGQQLIYLHQQRLSSSAIKPNEYLADEKMRLAGFNGIDDAWQYLTAIYLLAHCKYTLCGRTGGAKGVLLMATPGCQVHTYNLGLY